VRPTTFTWREISYRQYCRVTVNHDRPAFWFRIVTGFQFTKFCRAFPPPPPRAVYNGHLWTAILGDNIIIVVGSRHLYAVSRSLRPSKMKIKTKIKNDRTRKPNEKTLRCRSQAFESNPETIRVLQNRVKNVPHKNIVFCPRFCCCRENSEGQNFISDRFECVRVYNLFVMKSRCEWCSFCWLFVNGCKRPRVLFIASSVAQIREFVWNAKQNRVWTDPAYLSLTSLFFWQMKNFLSLFLTRNARKYFYYSSKNLKTRECF